MRHFSVIAFLVVLLIATGQSHAEEMYLAIPPGGDVRSTAIQGDLTVADGFGSVTETARAFRGGVSGLITGQFTVPALETRRFDPAIFAFSSGEMTFEGSTPTIQTSLAVDLHGVLVSELLPSAAFTTATGEIRLAVTIGGLTFQYVAEITKGAGPRTLTNNFTGLQFSGNGDSLGIEGGGQTTEFIVPTNVPVPVTYSMQLSFVHLSSGFAGTTNFGALFGNTFSFATDRPVFDLPPGYTVNGFGIVDNRFGVPEPTTGLYALLLLGAAALRPRRVNR